MVLIGLVLFHFLAGAYPLTPNPEITTGDFCRVGESDYRGRRYPEKIPYCERNVSSSEKREIYETYSIPQNCRRRFIIDHFIPLSVGGSNDPENLWPQHVYLRDLTNDVEHAVFAAVKEGRMTQAEAVARVKFAKYNPPMEMVQIMRRECDQVDQ